MPNPQLIVKSFAQYHGGYKPKIVGGIMSSFNVGMIYVFKDHFVFKPDVAQSSNYWEIVIPISSVIIDNWSYDGKSISKNSSKDGVGIEKISGTDYLVIPYLDNDGILQRPKFGIMRILATKYAVGTSSYFRGGGLKKLWHIFYNIILETHRDKLQAQSSKQIGNEDYAKYDIKQWIDEWEGLTLDFKLKDILSDNFKLGRTMVSFGNNKDVEQNFGGRLVIGVNDKTKKIEGVDFDPKHEEHIMNIARDKCEPPISPVFEKINYEGKTLYVVTIPKMTTTPYRLKTRDGLIHLIRVGSTIREPDSIETARLYNNLSAQTAEDSRQKQLLGDLLNSFVYILGIMQPLYGLAKSKALMTTQNKELFEKKNDKIDETMKLVQNPLTVIDGELKSKVIAVLQMSRYKPAYEAMAPSLVLARKQKCLENGWKENYLDFNIDSRMVDNDTIKAIEGLDDIIKKLKSDLAR
ncbi:MAG: AlbA family DNA-binding domain-containing protein [Nitrosotalea sp.]